MEEILSLAGKVAEEAEVFLLSSQETYQVADSTRKFYHSCLGTVYGIPRQFRNLRQK